MSEEDKKAAAEFRRKGDIYVLFNRTPTKDALLNEIREGHLIDKIIDYAFTAGMLHERKKHEWVSVRIRQPEKPGNYLVYRIPRQYTEGVMTGRWAYSYAPITTRSWNGERWQSDQEVTHWQPLSNPPKELEEK